VLALLESTVAERGDRRGRGSATAPACLPELNHPHPHLRRTRASQHSELLLSPGRLPCLCGGSTCRGERRLLMTLQPARFLLRRFSGQVMDRVAPGRAHHTQDERQTTAETPGREANLVETGLLATAGAVFLMLLLAACGITGDRPQAVALTLPQNGTPVNNPPGSGLTKIVEVFLIDGDNVLQLTSFRRVDTYSVSIGVDRYTVFFAASADPWREPVGRMPAVLHRPARCKLAAVDAFQRNLALGSRLRL
jgi:hypothetical protein